MRAHRCCGKFLSVKVGRLVAEALRTSIFWGMALFILLAISLSWAVLLPMVHAGLTVSPGALPMHFPGLPGPAALVEVARRGHVPWINFSILSGLPQLPPLTFFAIVLLVNGFGEEIGWRGFLLPPELPR
jgi:membrane protease YdiL (CAAX protease family)